MKNKFGNFTLLKLFLVTICFSVGISYGQHTSKNIRNKLEISEKLRGEGRLQDTYNTLKEAELQALSSSVEYLPQIYTELVKYYFAMKKNDLAKEYTHKATTEAEKINSPEALAYGYYAKAYYYNYLDIRNLAVENCQLALSIANENHIDALKPRIYYILYGAYSSFDHTELAQKYALETIKSAEKVKNYNLLSNAYSAMATVMGYFYTKSQNEIYKDSILIYLNKSAMLYNQHPNEVSSITYAITNINIADYYYRNGNLSDKNTLDKIKNHTLLAQSLTKESSPVVQANANGLLAEVAVNQGDYQTAEKLLNEAFVQMKTQQTTDYYTLTSITEALVNLYQKQGNYQKALYLKTEKEHYNAKLYDQNQLEQISRLEAEFENKQIKQEISNVKQLAETRKLLNFLYIGISVLVIFSLFFVVRNHKNKIRLQTEKQLRLEKEKDEAQAKALLKEKERRLLSIQKSQMEREIKMQLRLEKEEQSRLKAEQELLQLKNEQMQKEVLANALQIDRKNKLLEEIKDKIKKEGNSFNIERVIRTDKFLDEAIEQTVKEFEDIHPDFFNKLNELSAHKLTSLDLKYCAYMFLKLSTKEIATVFNVEPKSIRMSKYRIKQKLNLPKDENLEDFLQTFG
ncbi:MAG: hypothetical protein Q4C98_01155 [Capnocytophaga sp.]|nr:hypothetical protein [Capnocytophaga sp.]